MFTPRALALRRQESAGLFRQVNLFFSEFFNNPLRGLLK